MYIRKHRDTSYLSEPKSRPRIRSHHFYLSDRPKDVTKPPAPGDPPPQQNGPLLSTMQVLNKVVSSAAEAEFACLYHNGKDAEPIHTTLEELGFKQSPMPMQTDTQHCS